MAKSVLDNAMEKIQWAGYNAEQALDILVKGMKLGREQYRKYNGIITGMVNGGILIDLANELVAETNEDKIEINSINEIVLYCNLIDRLSDVVNGMINRL